MWCFMPLHLCVKSNIFLNPVKEMYYFWFLCSWANSLYTILKLFQYGKIFPTIYNMPCPVSIYFLKNKCSESPRRRLLTLKINNLNSRKKGLDKRKKTQSHVWFSIVKNLNIYIYNLFFVEARLFSLEKLQFFKHKVVIYTCCY